MKKFLAVLCLLHTFLLQSQVSPYILSLSEEVVYNNRNQAVFVKFNPGAQITDNTVAEFINSHFAPGESTRIEEFRKETDAFGYTHRRFKIYSNGVELYNKVIVSHAINGYLISLNGDLSLNISNTNGFRLNEKQALQFALAKIKAKKYKWDNKEEEAHMRLVLNQPNFSYYPKGKKILFEKNTTNLASYVFTIYAEEPLYKANVVVNATTGEIISEENLICSVDVPGTAQTKFSGTQSITCDQTGAVFSLRETQRGNGIETYNLNYGTNYGAATNFTNASATWTGTGADQGARDAHWGAEKTYDYFWNQHNRNSIDNAGFKLLSYVHYNSNYANAFWDGARMTYGDGNGTSTFIFTTIDICGHEITHGLTSNSSNLIYNGESGALNESYSDIFGTLIENYGRPGNWNWKVGEDMTANGNGIRNMQNPALFSDPDTYGGQFWYTGTADNGGVHTNSGVSNFWFYLLSMGGNGSNDLAQTYSVSALGLNQAAQIAFRALTLYYTPNTNYANARLLTIQAAKDLFGNCSNQVIQTTNAWHAVGVGPAYVPGLIGANFIANKTNFCTSPATVSFNNTTTNGISYVWDFGDGSANVTATNVVHTYTSNGTYTIKLKATGCNNGNDSIIKPAYIVVNAPAAPSATGASACENNSMVLTASGNNSINWFPGSNATSPIASGNTFATPNLSTTTTYYAANTISNSPMYGGILNISGGGNLANASQWLVFDVNANATLNSVEVFAQGAGNRVIQMRNSASTVIFAQTVSLTAGNNTVQLNFNLTPGVNYQLGLAGGSNANLYRSNSGVTYPYNIGGIVNIKNSSAGSAFYYWFYNWKITEADCMSPLVAVTASVLPKPQVSISNSNGVCMNDEISLIGSPAGGVFSGNGVSGTTFIPPNSSGSYQVNYTYTDANNCSASDSIQFIVSECVGLPSVLAENNEIEIYPNPANEIISLYASEKSQIVSYSISDASGRLVLQNAMDLEHKQIDISSLSKGLYFICMQNTSGIVEKVIKLVKE
ncbi:MAG: M4 family metallopeptidase [Bacteroidia bacterium]|nr:M4 family metallopeptidase [Bacteroidia bacterium]